MIIIQEQYSRIEAHLPFQRGNMEIDNITFINALLYAMENGCEWRALPERFGEWNSVYAHGALKKRKTGNQQERRRLEYQTSCGFRGR
jgi:transposase